MTNVKFVQTVLNTWCFVVSVALYYTDGVKQVSFLAHPVEALCGRGTTGSAKKLWLKLLARDKKKRL